MYKSTLTSVLLMAIAAGAPGPASAQSSLPINNPKPPPFTATLTNNAPLSVGMNVEETSYALDAPLKYISGRPGDETYLAYRPGGGSELLPHRDRLYLQFRKGQLAGWKGDWGRNWMWQ